MAERHPLHQPSAAAQRLEAGTKLFNPPLLPFEKDFIRLLGCTEDEYREFVRHAELRSRVRPAGYEHIPEIVGDPVSIIVSLVVGVALSAVSSLLTPKPQLPSAGKEVTNKDLPDQVGPSSFNQTTAFDSVAALAEYGQPIPIPFGKLGTGSDGKLTGGLVLAPSLVWSRCFSYGSYQRFLGMYVAGEWSLAAPNVNGMWLGTTPMTALASDDFAVFWSSRETGNRLNPNRLIAGTTGSDSLGAPTVSGDIMLCPTSRGTDDEGFSMAYNPRSKATFGTSTPIHNGSVFRFNWEVVTNPGVKDQDDDAKARVRDFRRKICGSEADGVVYGSINILGFEKTGMPGVGRAYSRKMGFIELNGAPIENRAILPIDVGSTAKFYIDGGNWKAFANDDFRRKVVKLDDLDSSADAWRQRADQLLSIGSKWIIGAAVWKVTARDSGIWTKGRNMTYTFECIETLGPKEIGIPGRRTVQEPLGGYEGADFNPNKHCGAAFYNICRFDDAVVRNVRFADVIEIGIRSQVWNKAAGLCNFNAIPEPEQLQNYDQYSISVNTPRMDKYFARTSCFSIWVRPIADGNAGGTVPPWSRIPQVFCVTGSAPIDQYNWLRIRPRTVGRYEYRFVPRTGSDIAIYAWDTSVYWRLNAQTGTIHGQDFPTAYGDFRITMAGDLIPSTAVRLNPELTSSPSIDTVQELSTAPSAVTSLGLSSNNGDINHILQAWTMQVLGKAAWNYAGQTHTGTFTQTKDGGARSITIKVTATSISLSGPTYQAFTGSSYTWQNHTYQVVSSVGRWTLNEPFNRPEAIPSGNPFRNQWGYSIVYHNFQISGMADVAGNYNVATGERIFEENSQVSDCSHYLELQKSNESAPEHQIVYVNECVANEVKPTYDGMSTMALSIKSSNNITAVDQPRIYTPTGINVERLVDGNVGPSNLFSDFVYYLLTSRTQGAGGIVPTRLIDRDSLVATGQFLRANRLFFDSVLEQPTNLREYIYNMAPLLLCNFTIKNGRFGMMPALPTDSSNAISTGPVPIEQIFTAGNIIEDSLNVEYIGSSQRKDFRAVVSYRTNIANELPSQSALVVEWADAGTTVPKEETIDLTDFCTNREQALLTARFLLSVRRRVDHTISFKTVPDGIAVGPGSYIRVVTEANTYNAANNGIITDAGTLVSATSVTDGTYPAVVYSTSTGEVTERSITVVSNTVTDSTLYNSIFTLLAPRVSEGVYQIEQLTLNEDALVEIAAVHVPTDGAMASIVAKDVMNPGLFRVFE